MQFSIDLRRTQHGLVYLFKSKDTFSSLTDMGEAITRFEGFMSLCQNDPKKAETILLNTGVHPAEASRLVTKYTRDYQRLELDMRHELEQKTLALGQRLESEVFELSYGEIHSLLPSEHISTLLSIPFNSGSVSINISSLSNSNNSVVQSLYEQTVNGDINYTNEDKQLIEMFERHAARLEAICLKSELEQLKDNSSPEEVRKTGSPPLLVNNRSLVFETLARA